MPIQIDPLTGERVTQSAIQIDPQTGERITAAPTAPPKPAPAPAGNTIGPAPSPGIFDRLRNTVANSAVGHSLESTMPKVADALNLHPTETVNSPDYQAHKQQFVAPEYLAPAPTSAAGRVTRGALKATGQLTSAPALAQTAGIAATGGLLAPLAASAGAAGTVGRVGMNALKYGLAAVGAQGVYQGGKKAVSLYSSGDTAGAQEAAGEVIPGAAMMIPAMGEPMKAAGEGMQRGGVEVINRTIGALKPDFKRGANPGEGYFQAGFGPSSSMRAIANKASVARESTGQQLGSLYDSATQAGVKIPTTTVASALTPPINRAAEILSGPGGAGNTGQLQDFSASFRPMIAKGVADGGITPTDLWGVKRNVAANTSWSDPTQVGMKQLRQQATGALSGVLSQGIPESKPLANQYQNLNVLANRTNSRALTGSMPLTSIAGKLASGTVGAAIGGASAGPKGALMAIPFMAADSVPAKTAAASSLYYGGKGMARTGNAISRLFGPLTLKP